MRKPIAIALVLAGSAAFGAPAAQATANQEFRNAVQLVIACWHVPGGCRDVKLLRRTHPSGCTREVWRLYPRRAKARIWITKACG